MHLISQAAVGFHPSDKIALEYLHCLFSKMIVLEPTIQVFYFFCSDVLVQLNVLQIRPAIPCKIDVAFSQKYVFYIMPVQPGQTPGGMYEIIDVTKSGQQVSFSPQWCTYFEYSHK